MLLLVENVDNADKSCLDNAGTIGKMCVLLIACLGTLFSPLVYVYSIGANNSQTVLTDY